MKHLPRILLPAAFLLLVGVAVAQEANEPKVGGKTAGEWAKLLKSANATERQTAADALGKLGPQAKEAAPALIEVLTDKDYFVAGKARETLVKIGPPAIPALVEAMKKPDLQPRIVPIVGEMGPEAKPAVPALIEALKALKPDAGQPSGRSALMFALSKIGEPAVPALTELLKDSEPWLRNHAATTLGMIGPKAKPAVPPLIELLKDTDVNNRREAVIALGAIGPDAKDAAAPIVEFIKNLPKERKDQANLAGAALGRIGKEAVPVLIGGLKDSDATVRYQSAWALSKIGSDAKEAVPALIEAVKSSDVQAIGATALGNIGPEAKAAVPELIDLLKWQGGPARKQAAKALGAIGPDAKDAVPALIKAMGEPPRFNDYANRDLDSECVFALGKIGAPAVPALIEQVKDRDPNNRNRALRALTAMGPAAKDAVPVLIDALKTELVDFRDIPRPPRIVIDPNPRSLSQPAAALRSIGKPAVPALIEVLKDPKAKQRDQVVAILGEIGPDAKEAVPVLIDAAKGSKDYSLQREIVQALGKLGADPKEAAPVLIEAMKTKDFEGGKRAGEELAKLAGPPAVVEALKHEDSQVRLHAATVLGHSNIYVKEAVPLLRERLKDSEPKVIARPPRLSS